MFSELIVSILQKKRPGSTTNPAAKEFLSPHEVPQESPKSLYQDPETRKINHDELSVPRAFAY
jgi:hypothetical protein